MTLVPQMAGCWIWLALIPGLLLRVSFVRGTGTFPFCSHDEALRSALRISTCPSPEPECLAATGATLQECTNPLLDAPTTPKEASNGRRIPHWPGQTCDASPLSLLEDLRRYPTISVTDTDKSEGLYGEHGRRYVIRDNQLYGRDGSDHAIVGVATMVQDVLTMILKHVDVPDIDFVLNCADHPTVSHHVVQQDRSKDAPVVSMCGSTHYRDIIVPTYTMALVATGRRSASYTNDMPWSERQSRLVWRGTDSNYDRFTFNQLANRADYIPWTDVGLSQMVRLPHDIHEHGPVRSFMPEPDFGNYKWIANVDGAVAAYRLPAVASLGSTIVKQESHYLEHWYRQLVPWVHYVPLQNDASDLGTVLEWLRTHDDEARRIGAAGRQFVLDHLQPQDILCFWFVFLHEYAARLTYQPVILPGMTLIGP